MRTVIFIDLSQIGQIPRDCSFFTFALLGRLVTKEVRELPSAELDIDYRCDRVSLRKIHQSESKKDSPNP